MTTESDECKRRIKAIELGIKPSRVDMRAGLISALAARRGIDKSYHTLYTIVHNVW